MTPPLNPPPSSPKTTTAGILAIIMGGLGLFMQIWGGAHGATLDATNLAGSAAAVTTGIGLVVAKDNKPKVQ